ncbi:ABC transporter substrate-binding protein [Corynebacterium sp. HMSC072G08]|uniref:ABC transporter family substrate-binding protein n=1 Tax=Corynebacterium sp. HMSC072G08 TaxID=1715039 RepID=UPI0008A2695F|nr:ABC transporter family substrate-binding protein [Corynebacterium sp. HMSC072G08]OFN44346.1 ABC transporter substrate-binding protein [Corynebacterium sp. HMSC072G08]
MKKVHRIRLAGVASLTTLALTLAACSSGQSESAEGQDGGEAVGGLNIEVDPAGDYNPKERDELKDGGELTLPIGELTEQMNAFHANMTTDTSTIWGWYNPQLALYDGKGEYTPNPDYITNASAETKDGKTVVTYDIVDKATFNDGTPIDWKAFENTWKMNNGEDKEISPNSTDGYELIESVERGDSDKQVKVTFQNAYPWWMGLFNQVLHPKVNTAQLYNETYLNELHPEYGAGPFKVDSIDFNAGNVTFVPNEKWWGDAPKLSKVTYRQLESQATINAFKAGEIDAAGVASKNNLTVAAEMGDAIDIRASMRIANILFTLNSQAPHLGDINVRHAIFNAIDRSQLAAIRYNGLGYTEDLPGSLTLYPTQDGYKDNLSEAVTYDPESSKKLLEEAGYAMGDDGYYAKDGEKLTLRYVLVGDDEVSKSTAAAIQKMLKDVGVEVTVQERPSSDFSKIAEERDFDIFLSGIASSDPYGVAYFGQTWLSDSDLNKSGTGTKELDEEIRELQKIDNGDDQIAKANELEVEAFKTYGLMPWANGPAMTGVKKGLANFGPAGFAVIPKEDIGWEK